MRGGGRGGWGALGGGVGGVSGGWCVGGHGRVRGVSGAAHQVAASGVARRVNADGPVGRRIGWRRAGW
ncbi:hypothetical protein DKG71_30670 [Streptomyces sp. NEAU-S7GS2]|nr:hypothetical protein DKG71_30670 [Streptomyces sp. NEAU-S7GS2]